MARILFCPHCGSTEIYYEIGGITGQIYHCHKCDYVGALVIEEELDELDLPQERKEVKTEKKRRLLRRKG